MSEFLTCVFIGISLSMDAFSLSLIYGTCGLGVKRQIVLSFIVSLFHFFMPLIGLFFGSFLMRYLVVNANLLVGVIFSIIGIEMILSIRDENEIRVLNSFFGYLFFGFTVSVDSLTTGIGLSVITNQYVMAFFLFMFFSGFFTYVGLRIGNRLNDSFGKYATFIGGIMMVGLGIIYIINFLNL